ncbi:MAG: hypothetical protein AAGM22_07545 [Acidobacteriota bacterium]
MFPETRFPFVLGLVTLVLAPMAPAEELLPEGEVPSVRLVNEAAEDGAVSPSYAALRPGDSASYLFCGEGQLSIASRAALDDGAGKARYAFDLDLDGAPAPREISHRAYAVSSLRFEGSLDRDGFESSSAAASLRRQRVAVARGCHRAELTLARSTAPAVGVRVTFRSKDDTKRAFGAAGLTGGRAVDVRVSKKTTPYRAADLGESLELTVDGPAWVRLLTRPIGVDEAATFNVVVERDGDPFRSIRIDNAPSRRARLVGEKHLRLGVAREVVFAAESGRSTYAISGADGALAVRAQVAPRDPAKLIPGEVRPSWSTRARISSYYDSNILRYSDRFIQRFDNGQDPGRFRVESLDDVVHRADLDIDRRFTGYDGQPARFSFGLTHRAYQRNSIKDWTQGRLRLRQNLRGGRSLGLFATSATDFYVRHIRDGDLRGTTADPFQAFEFEKSEVGLRFTQELGASWLLSLDLSQARFRHSENFREFDSEDSKARLRFDHQLTRRTRFSYAVEYTDSDAQGFDEPGETRATSDDTDPTYRQVDLILSARFELPTERRQVIFIQAEAGEREYTTDKLPSVAPLHFNRTDDLFRLFASWDIRLTDRLNLTVFGQLRDRSSTIPDDLDVGDVKNYDQYEAGVRLTARFD